jgi:hypothetical protein
MKLKIEMKTLSLRKEKIMRLRTEIEHIKSELDKVKDVHLIEAIKNLLAYGKVKRYETKLEPMSKADFYSRNELSRKSIETNDLVSQSEAKAYFSNKMDSICITMLGRNL